MRSVAVEAAASLVTVFVVAMLVYTLLSLAPGDPLPTDATSRAALAQRWGLDTPWSTRWLRQAGQLLRGDLGTSMAYRPGVSVGTLIAPAIRTTARWWIPTVAGAVLTATAWSWWSHHRARWTRHVTPWLGALPAFVLAYLLVDGLNALTWWGLEQERWARPAWFALPQEDHPMRTALAAFALIAGSGTFATLHTALAHQLTALDEAPWVVAARGRGETVRRQRFVHLLPHLAAWTAERAAMLLGAAVVIEHILLIPGAGALLWRACAMRDYELVVALVTCSALTVVLLRTMAHATRVTIDPRHA